MILQERGLANHKHENKNHENKKENLSEEEFTYLISAIEGTVHLRNKKERKVTSNNTGKYKKGEICFETDFPFLCKHIIFRPDLSASHDNKQHD